MPDGILIHQSQKDEDADIENQNTTSSLVKYFNQTFLTMLMAKPFSEQEMRENNLQSSPNLKSSRDQNSSVSSFNNFQNELEEAIDPQKQFADYKERMQKSKKHLDKIYLKKTAYKIENQEVTQVH